MPCLEGNQTRDEALAPATTGWLIGIVVAPVCRRPERKAALGGELPFPISPACDAHGLIADPQASVARIAAKRRVAVITPVFPLAATRLPLSI